jgi:hypothetical protein
MNPLAVKAIVALVALSIAFIAGWRVKGAFVAERDLAIVEAKQEFLESYRQAESEFSAALEGKLSTLKANERVINNEIIKIVDRPVYMNTCLDADGIALIERARKGEHADPADAADK